MTPLPGNHQPPTPNHQRQTPNPQPRSLHLVLFDIDGTLLNIHGAGRLAFSRAVEAVFGWENAAAEVDFAGATDLLILRRICAAHDRAATRVEERAVFQRLPVELERAMPQARHTLHPGVRELLEALRRRADCLIGLVTGNIESCARMKLQQFNLETFFAFGGYGDDHADRADIARVAIANAERLAGEERRVRRVTLIGDALSDLQAARALGARSVAVATGSHSAATLRDAGADAVVGDLSDTRHVLALLDLGAAAVLPSTGASA